MCLWWFKIYMLLLHPNSNQIEEREKRLMWSQYSPSYFLFPHSLKTTLSFNIVKVVKRFDPGNGFDLNILKYFLVLAPKIFVVFYSLQQKPFKALHFKLQTNRIIILSDTGIKQGSRKQQIITYYAVNTYSFQLDIVWTVQIRLVVLFLILK